MKKLSIQELKGIWRSEDNIFRYDLTIREIGASMFSQISNQTAKTLNHIEGNGEIIYNDETEEQSFWIDEKFEIQIIQFSSNHDDAVFGLDKSHYRFKRIVNL